MNSPYMGLFKVTQGFRLSSNPSHDGLDLVGINSKNIHSTVNGTVIHADWENPNNHSQGFGLYVCIEFSAANNEKRYAYFGHMSSVLVKKGDKVKITDVIGVEGNTGYSTGRHCHYEVRKGFYKGAEVVNICDFSGIPNEPGNTYDDGYRENNVIIHENCKITIDETNKKIEIRW